MSKSIKIEEAVKTAVSVSNDTDLKTEIAKGTLMIISTDPALYSRLLKKFPKEKVSKNTKSVGGALAAFGVLITVITAGAFSFIGLPLAGIGAAMGIAGITLDDYTDYTIGLDYDAHHTIFMKLKGDPHISKRSLKKIGNSNR